MSVLGGTLRSLPLVHRLRCECIASVLDLDLIQFQIHGSFSAEHGDDHIHRIVFDLDALHGTGEATQRTVENPDSIANNIVDNDFLLLNTHLVDFVVGEGEGVISGCANRKGN